MEDYTGALLSEMALLAPSFGGAQIATVYVGGGTPSLLPLPLWERLLEGLHRHFALPAHAEFTVEANPGTVTKAWLALVKSGGCNRLSLGVQAAQDKLLKALGRIHTFAQAGETAEMARNAGFANLNMDLMFGLPGQTLEMYLDSLRQVTALEPTHLSAYSLIVEEGTPLSLRIAEGAMPLPQEDMVAAMYQQGRDWLETHGYPQYEISNFARPGCCCRHNLVYWQGGFYLGLGVGAASMLPWEGAQPSHAQREGAKPPTEGAQPSHAQREGAKPPTEGAQLSTAQREGAKPPTEGAQLSLAQREGAKPLYLRRENQADIPRYQRSLAQGRLPVLETHAIDREEAMFETMMLGLRTTSGVSRPWFLRRFGLPLESVYGKEMKQLAAQGLAQDREEAFTLTQTGLMLQNQVLLKLMK